MCIRDSSTTLLLGETGTGKELLAHGIHAASRRTGRPFVGVNIAAVPDTLLEAEFFGVAPGAYTGADRKGREGKFKLADGGTLFLDEIGDMPLALQSKLLRALQEQEIEPLGSNRVERVDAVSYTHLDVYKRQWQFVERGFHFGRVDVEAAADHQILAAADQGEIAVIVDAPHVAGLEPQVGGELVGRLLRHAPVALEDVGAFDFDAADVYKRQSGGLARNHRAARQPFW